MGGRKILASMGLLLLAGAAAAVITLRRGGEPLGAALPAAPAWDPLRIVLEELASADPVQRLQGGRHANDYGDPVLDAPLTACLAICDAALQDARITPARRDAERRARITVAAALCRLEGTAGDGHTERFVTDADPMVRRAAILSAERRGFVPAANVMRALLQDSDPQVQLAAASAAGALRMAAVAESVHAAARGDGPAAPRMLAATAQIGAAGAADVIAEALRDGARVVPAGEAAVLLGPAAVPTLAALLKDPREVHRRIAADALRRIGGEPVIALLLPALHDASLAVRRIAAQSLAAAARTGERLAVLEVLATASDPAVLRDLGRALQRIAEPADATAIAAAARRAPDDALADLMAALGKCGGPQAQAALAELAARNSNEALRGLAEAGGVRHDPAMIPAITPLFLHGHYTVQAAAVRAAARAGTAAPEAWRAACEALLASPVETVRLAAAEALSGADPARAAAAALRVAESPNPQHSAGAWQCLTKLRGAPGRAAVRAALAHGTRDPVAARFGALAALELKMHEAAPLVAALIARAPGVPPLDKPARHAIARALAELGSSGQVAALIPWTAHDDLELQGLTAAALFRMLGTPATHLQQARLMPLRLPYWARRWWERNQGKPEGAWAAPRVPRVPTV